MTTNAIAQLVFFVVVLLSLDPAARRLHGTGLRGAGWRSSVASAGSSG